MISRASPVRRVSRVYAGGLALFVLLSSTRDLLAQGLPVDTGSHIPVAIWFVGAGILGLVMAYGIFRTRSRTRAEKQLTERATRQLYADEGREESRGADV
jgi:hypothetical protein